MAASIWQVFQRKTTNQRNEMFPDDPLPVYPAQNDINNSLQASHFFHLEEMRPLS